MRRTLLRVDSLRRRRLLALRYVGHSFGLASTSTPRSVYEIPLSEVDLTSKMRRKVRKSRISGGAEGEGVLLTEFGGKRPLRGTPRSAVMWLFEIYSKSGG
jgi:hypothetical protein